MRWSESGNFEVDYTRKKIVGGYYLAKGRKAEFSQTRDKIIIIKPDKLPPDTDTVFKLQIQ
jgi:hypothetical protein